MESKRIQVEHAKKKWAAKFGAVVGAIVGAIALIVIGWAYLFYAGAFSDLRGNNADLSIAQAQVLRAALKVISALGFLLVLTGWTTLSYLRSERRITELSIAHTYPE
ncbi:MAG TPA: hypothetical protein VF773_20955 [Verrucomicrobiae bacterium]